MMRGERSRAGLIAYPVGPPSDSPMPTTRNATSNVASPLTLDPLLPASVIARIPRTSTNVPTISVNMFQNEFRIAGPVENTASLRPGSPVCWKCCQYVPSTSTAPIAAPMNSPIQYWMASPKSMPPLIQIPRVTAGLRCAPENWPTAYAPAMTPKPHPKVITIQPEFSAFDLARRTAATTPSPRRISSMVPMISAGMMSTRLLSPPPGEHLGQAGTFATLDLRTAVRQRPLG